MAGRVNKKFVFGLSAVLILLVGGLAGFYYVFVYQDPAELIAQGDAQREQGHLQLAIEDYGKALRRRPSDLNLIDKYIASLQRVQVTNDSDRREYLRQVISWSRRATELRPDDPKLFERLYGFMLKMARRLPGISGYNQLYSLASTKLNSHPDNLVSRKYRGIAQVHRYAAALSDADWKQALDDLTRVYEKHPEDPEVAHAIALWQLQQADVEQAQGGQENLADAKKLRAQAVKVSAQSLAQKPDDPDRMIGHVRVLTHHGVNDAKAARPILQRLEQSLLKRPRPVDHVTAVADLLTAVDQKKVTVKQGGAAHTTTRGRARAEKLLRVALKADPGAVVYLYKLGRIDQRQGENDQAIQEFRQAGDAKTQGTVLASLRSTQLQRQASFHLGNLLLAKADHAGGKQKTKLLAQVDKIADQLAGPSGGTPPTVNLLRGKLALARGRNRQATVYLDRASNQLHDADPQVLLLSAKARQATHEWGAAAQRLEALLQLRPDLTPVRRELVRIYLKNNDLGKARDQLQTVLQQTPKDPRALIYQANLLARQGRIDQAIAAYSKLDAKKATPKITLTLASLYARTGQKDRARSLLRQRLQKAPDDISAVQLLLGLTKDPEQKLAILGRAREAGANKQAVRILRLSVEGKGPGKLDKMIQAALSSQKDPLKRALTAAKLYLRQGDADKARAAVAQAAKIDANNPDVIRMRFSLALQDKRFDRAQKLIDQAAAQNLDVANGVFFRARLYAAKGDMASAVAAMRQGLQARPVYARGWRMLGDMLMRTKDTGGAADAYQRAIDQKPDNLAALRGLSRAYTRENRPQDVLNTLRSAYQFHPGDAGVRDTFLTYQSEHGDAQAALSGWKRAVAQHPGDDRARRGLVVQLNRMDKSDQALKAAHQLVAQQGKTRRNIVLLAQTQRAAGQGGEGLQTLKNYLAQLGHKPDMDDRLLIPRYEASGGNLGAAVAGYRAAAEHEDPKVRRATRELADTLFDRGLDHRALSLYQDLHRTIPGDKSVTRRLAETLVRLNKGGQAQKLLGQLPKDDPASRMLHALIAQRNGELNKAKGILDTMIGNNADNALLYYQRARVEMAQDPRSDDARADLNKALDLDPSMGQARVTQAQLLSNRGRWDQAVTVLRQELDRSPRNLSARLHLYQAYQRAGDADAARRLAEQSQKNTPNSPIWPRELGRLAAGQGRLDQAVTHWKRAVELAPTPQDLFHLADALVRDKQADAALALLRDHAGAVNQQPVLEAARARALAAKGKDDQAARAFALALGHSANVTQALSVTAQMAQAYPAKKVIAMLPQPDDPVHAAWVDLAAARLLLGDKQAKPALARARAALDALPDTGHDQTRARANRLIATASYQAKDYDTAKQAYKRLLSASPKNVGALNDFAYLLADNLNDPKAGLKLARQAASLARDNAQVLDTLGYCQMLTGNLNDARDSLQQSLQQQTFAANSFHMAQVFHRQHRADQARQWIQRAIELAGKSGDRDTLRKARALSKQL